MLWKESTAFLLMMKELSSTFRFYTLGGTGVVLMAISSIASLYRLTTTGLTGLPIRWHDHGSVYKHCRCRQNSRWIRQNSTKKLCLQCQDLCVNVVIHHSPIAVKSDTTSKDSIISPSCMSMLEISSANLEELGGEKPLPF